MDQLPTMTDRHKHTHTCIDGWMNGWMDGNRWKQMEPDRKIDKMR